MTDSIVVNFLGPTGTFSESAARSARSVWQLYDTQIVPKPRISAVADLNFGELGVLPYYNLLEGLVQESLDGIAYNNLVVIGLVRLPIIFGAGCIDPTVKPSSVHSHPKALGQCFEYIAKSYPDVPCIPVASTAAAASAAMQNSKIVAIASHKTIKANGLKLVGEDIANIRYGQRNYTDFLTTSHRESIPESFEEHQCTHTLLLIAPETDRPGLLAGLLKIISDHNLNLTKLHSRPSPIPSSSGKGEPQAFFIELECYPDHIRLTDAVKEIEISLDDTAEASVQILGGFSVQSAEEI